MRIRCWTPARTLGPGLLILLVAALASPAGATSIGASTSGVVASRAGDLGVYFQDGETVQITFTFDDSVADVQVDPTEALYPGALQSLTIDFLGSGLSFAFATGGPLDIVGTMDNQGTSPMFQDGLFLSSSNPTSGSLGGFTDLSVTAAFAESGLDPMLIVNELPPSGVFDFDLGFLAFAADDGQGGLLTGGVQLAQVPEPSTAALCLLGLAGLSARRRARQSWRR